MDFSDKELKIVLQALYRFRGDVSGFSQEEQNKLGVVESLILRIESKVGPLKAQKTRFDREMEESLSILKTGKAGAAKERKAAEAARAAPSKAPAKTTAKAPTLKKTPKAATALDKGKKPPRVKKESGSAKSGAAKKRSAK